MPSDLPLVTAGDILTLIHANPSVPGVSLAPTGMTRARMHCFSSRLVQFITSLAHRGLRSTRRSPAKEYSPRSLRLPGFGLDVDLPDDLEAYRSSSRVT